MDICQRIITTKDTNGNTRAIWLAYFIPQTPYVHQKDLFVGQGYMESGGNRPAQLRGWYVLPELEVTPREYQEIVRDLKRQGKITY